MTINRFAVGLLLILGLAVLAAPAVQAQPFNPAANRIGFDYKVSDFTTYEVTHVEARIDAGPWVGAGLPTAETLPDTLPGLATYGVPFPALTLGDHTVQFRVCNVAGCSPESALYSFRVTVAPPATSNTRIIPPRVP